MRVLKKFRISAARREITYDSKHNVTEGEAITDKPLSFYVKKGIGTKVKGDVTPHQQSEEQVVTSCTRWLKASGWTVRTLFTGGIPIGGGRYATNPCKGIPDCIVFNISAGETIWIEFKKTKGSPEQSEWHHQLKRCGQTILVVTSLESLKEQLEAIMIDKKLKKSA
jgi:hypothetical protein